MNTTITSLHLFWDNPFDALPPDQVIITYTATKLSGQSLVMNETLTINTTDLSSGTSSDFSYTLSDLLFYTQYSVSMVAVYNGNQNSAPVSAQGTTIEGGVCTYTFSWLW